MRGLHHAPADDVNLPVVPYARAGHSVKKDREAGHYDRSMLKPHYPLVTTRLTLRPYTMDDLDFVYDLQSRPEVTRYLYFGPRDRDKAREALQVKRQSAALKDEGDSIMLGVVLNETGALVADVMLRWLNREHQLGEVGYIVHPDHGGKGYATEAAEAMLRLGFEEVGLHRIVGRLDARNSASARVLERLGMRREAHLRENEFVKGEWTDELVYAMLQDEWRSRAGR
jgi:RimJ/RimL family protein N-acetyltransferase